VPYFDVNRALGRAVRAVVRAIAEFVRRAVRAVARVAAEFVGLGWRSGSRWAGALALPETTERAHVAST
jgi:hypothetical protein